MERIASSQPGPVNGAARKFFICSTITAFSPSVGCVGEPEIEFGPLCTHLSVEGNVTVNRI